MLKCSTLRRPCSITKKQYSNWNVRVGTVKKSKATTTSRWLARKVEPVFDRIAASTQALQISGDGTPGDLQAELQKLHLDLRCSPARILSRHAADESPNLLGHLGSAAGAAVIASASTGESLPMPSDHRLRFYNDQNIRPSRPYLPQSRPEEAVEAVH
jgi:hypothetical protein